MVLKRQNDRTQELNGFLKIKKQYIQEDAKVIPGYMVELEFKLDLTK